MANLINYVDDFLETLEAMDKVKTLREKSILKQRLALIFNKCIEEALPLGRELDVAEKAAIEKLIDVTKN